MRHLRIIAVITIALTAATAARAAFSPSQWQFRKAIVLQDTGYIRLNLDAESFAGLQPDLRDLRVVDSGGQEVPFKLVVERQAGDTQERRVAVLNNAYTPDAYQSFMVDVGVTGTSHNWLRILTNEKNFQHRVEIAGSNNAVDWQVLKSDGYIFGHTEPLRSFAVQETSLTYPDATFRYLQVKIFSDLPFTVNGVALAERIAPSAKEVVFTPAFSQTEDAEAQVSVLTLDFGQGGLPTHELTLQTTALNFDRPAELFSSDDGNRWQRLGSGYFFTIATSKFSGRNLTLNYPETAARYLRISVINGDDQPLAFTGATARGILRSVVFNANLNQQYYLYYGNSTANYPVYDIERIFPYLEVSQIPGATLGPQQINPAYVIPAPPVVPFTERYPWLLPGVLMAIAFVLLGFILYFVKQVKR